MRSGRPFGFLLLVILFWTGGRVGILNMPEWRDLAPALPSLAARAEATPIRKNQPVPEVMRRVDDNRVPGTGVRMLFASSPLSPSDSPAPAAPALVHRPISATPAAALTSASPLLQPIPPITSPGSPKSWLISSWLLLRHGAEARRNSPGYLGDSQAGIRLAYDVTPSRPFAVSPYVRLVSALKKPHAVEATIGLSVAPHRRLPVSIAVERRNKVSQGGRNAFAVLAAGSLPPTPIGAQFSVEGYAQGGMVGLHSTDGFADGKLSITRPLSSDSPFRLGMAVAGNAQPGLSRLDIGPALDVRLPIANTRLQIEWRQRIAGKAAPGSGPALTLATDF